MKSANTQCAPEQTNVQSIEQLKWTNTSKLSASKWIFLAQSLLFLARSAALLCGLVFKKICHASYIGCMHSEHIMGNAIQWLRLSPTFLVILFSDNFILLFHYNAAHMFMIYGHRDGNNSRDLGCS